MSFDFADVSLTGWVLAGALAALGVVLLVIARGHIRWTARMLANAALCLALAFVLSYIKLFDLPQGGAVTAASLLPIVAFAYSYGLAPGLVVGVAYGLLQMIQDPWIVTPVQAILDYPLAFACIALAAVARKLPDSWGWLAGMALAAVGRFVCHTFTGVVFFAEYAEGTGMTPFVYSVSYNSFVFVDMAICAVVMAFPQVRGALKRMTER
ncbi:MAG TPA: energy-coupled thiamine transporter ThiT [Candidatus Limiplasma pullistercoris]|nr:energy-coupled thiamine transporter ThiT [Candidatus Limiplasma pullistercoris]